MLLAAQDILQSHTGSTHDLLVRLTQELAKHIAHGACTPEQAEDTLDSLLLSLGDNSDDARVRCGGPWGRLRAASAEAPVTRSAG